MALQIAVFLLFVLFTGGHAFSCFQCTSATDSCSQVTTCSTGVTNCYATTSTDGSVNSTKVIVKKCAASADCVTGSINLGFLKTSSYCCNTEQCNNQEAALSNTTTGKSCFFCVGNNCTNTVSCTGNEDRCIKASGTFGNQTIVVKGCATKSVCDSAGSLISSAANVTCCEGNLCNGAQSVTQSFLFLCGSLISYFLLH